MGHLLVAAAEMSLHELSMSAWLAFVLMTISGTITVLSTMANLEPVRKGKLRFLSCHRPGWGEREESPGFFMLGLALSCYRTLFFAVVPLCMGAYFLEALGIII